MKSTCLNFGVVELSHILQDVLSRLSGGTGNRVLKLITPFGGGKSHTLASLFHAARKRDALDAIPAGKPLPKTGKVNVAVFDGQFFSASNGKEFPACAADLSASGNAQAGVAAGRPHFKGKANTLWGWIAGCLGGQAGYELVRVADEARVAPGGDDILKVLGDAPNLILLDEVLEYLISAGGIKVIDTTLRDETLNFIKRLTVAVSNAPKSALVFSIQSSKPRETLDYSNLFHTLDHMAARQDQLREPVEKDEVLRVIQRRLLAKMPEDAASTPAATAFQANVTAMRCAYAKSPAEQQQAEQEGIELRDRIRAAYPFHPALIDLMRERAGAAHRRAPREGVPRRSGEAAGYAHRHGHIDVFLRRTATPVCRSTGRRRRKRKGDSAAGHHRGRFARHLRRPRPGQHDRSGVLEGTERPVPLPAFRRRSLLLQERPERDAPCRAGGRGRGARRRSCARENQNDA